MMQARTLPCAAAAALALLALAAPPQAQAAACDGSSDRCTIDLGRATLTLGLGAASYFAGADVAAGNDVSFGANPDLFAGLQVLHGIAGDGISFLPQVYASVGGSGFDGWHSAVGWFEFNDIAFAAKPGFRIDGLDLTVAGTLQAYGEADVSLSVPGVPVVDGMSFASSARINPDTDALRVQFQASASYLQGEDGTAQSYGTASASLDSASLMLRISAVPEPTTLALWALGLAALGGRGAGRRGCRSHAAGIANEGKPGHQGAEALR